MINDIDYEVTEHDMWEAILRGYWYAHRAIAKDWEDLSRYEINQVERDYMARAAKWNHFTDL